MIRIGPAGIPLSCKGRTLKDGIIYTKSLELDALEVQFVRGIRMTEEDAAEVGEVAEAADVELHVHAPYYTNLAGDERNLKLTHEKVMKAANLANIMGAETVVVHPGFYGSLTPEEAMERVVRVVGDFRDEFKSNQWKPRLGVEMMGKRSVFGSLDEVVDVCKQVDDVLPVVDFAHIHARGNGSLNTVEDFQDVFDRLIPLGLNHYLIHFTGVLYENGNERHHLPIKKGDLRFEPLVEAILENDYNVTLISTSPILEHDAMYMQIVLDRVKEKREQRLQKEAQKAREDADKAAQEAEAAATSAREPEKAAPPPKPEPKPEPEPRPQCAAFTKEGKPCQNPARTGSKYCSSHRGYRPPKPAKPAKAEKKAPQKKEAKAAAPARPKASSGGTVKKKATTTKKATPSSKAAPKPKTKGAAKKSAKGGGKKTPVKKAPAKKATAKKPAAATRPAVPKTATKGKPRTARTSGTKKPASTTKGTQARTARTAPSPPTAGADDAAKNGVGSRLKAAARRLTHRKGK